MPMGRICGARATGPNAPGWTDGALWRLLVTVVLPEAAGGLLAVAPRIAPVVVGSDALIFAGTVDAPVFGAEELDVVGFEAGGGVPEAGFAGAGGVAAGAGAGEDPPGRAAGMAGAAAIAVMVPATLRPSSDTCRAAKFAYTAWPTRNLASAAALFTVNWNKRPLRTSRAVTTCVAGLMAVTSQHGLTACAGSVPATTKMMMTAAANAPRRMFELA